MILNELMTRWPLIEVAAKSANAYLPLPPRATSLARRIFSPNSTDQGPGSLGYSAAAARDALAGFMRDLGAKPSEVLLVHSGNTVCAALGLSPAQTIDHLHALSGPAGTLVMPTTPFLKGDPAGRDRYRDEAYRHVPVFDPRRSPPSTGILPRQLMVTNGAKRGCNPLNNLTALGLHADELFRSELQMKGVAPCGKGSPWETLERLDPLIVAINCGFAHSVTMIHRVEEADPADWIIPEDRWYRRRSVRIKDGESEQLFELRERRACWGVFFTERTLERRLLSDGIVHRFAGHGLELAGCRTSSMLGWARAQRRGFPYLIPWWLR